MELWRPYQRAEFTYKSNWGDHFIGRDPDWQTECFCWSSYLIDPRTARFGGLATVLASGAFPGGDVVGMDHPHPLMFWPDGAPWLRQDAHPGRQAGAGPPGPRHRLELRAHPAYNWYDPLNPSGVAENNETAWNEPLSFAYKDPDDVRRIGVAGLNEYNKSMFIGNPMAARYSLGNTGKLTAGESMAGRPMVINRPFRAVAELAYAFRGTPWRDIDFLTATSPDAGFVRCVLPV